MSYSSRRTRYDSYSRSVSRSRSPYSRSVSRSLSRSRSRSRSRDSIDAENPGNNLYVTGLSSRVTEDELLKHFESEGKVTDVHVVVDPWTRESRGFGFVTMATLEEADRCIKYLDRSVLEGRVITVEKARRRRGRTPTPGRYLGARAANGRRRSRSYSSCHRYHHSSRSPSYSPERDRSYSPYHRRRYHSPYYRRRHWSRSTSPYSRYSRSPPAYVRPRRSYSRDSLSRSPQRSVSPYYRRRYLAYTRRSISPDAQYGSRHYSRSFSPRRYRRRSYSRSYSPTDRSYRRSYSRSFSPRDRRYRRSCARSYSPKYRRSPTDRTSQRSCSRSYSPVVDQRHGGHGPNVRPSRSPSCRYSSPKRSKRNSRESYAHSRSVSSSSVGGR